MQEEVAFVTGEAADDAQAGVADGGASGAAFDDGVVAHAREHAGEIVGGSGDVAVGGADHGGGFLEVLQADQAGGGGAELAGVVGADDGGELAEAVADVFQGVVAVGLLQAQGVPLVRRGPGLAVGVIRGRQLVLGEAEAFFGGEVAVVFLEVAAQAELAGHVLGDADVAEARVLQGDAVVGVPAAQEAAADLDGHAAQGRAVVHPARIAEPHPGFAVALLHVLDADAAHVVGEHVIAGAGDGVGQLRQAELVEARQELLQVLAAEQPEHPVPHHLRAPP